MFHVRNSHCCVARLSSEPLRTAIKLQLEHATQWSQKKMKSSIFTAYGTLAPCFALVFYCWFLQQEILLQPLVGIDSLFSYRTLRVALLHLSLTTRRNRVQAVGIPVHLYFSSASGHCSISLLSCLWAQLGLGQRFKGCLDSRYICPRSIGLVGVAASPHALLQSSIGPIIVNFRLESVDSTSILSYHDALFWLGNCSVLVYV